MVYQKESAPKTFPFPVKGNRQRRLEENQHHSRRIQGSVKGQNRHRKHEPDKGRYKPIYPGSGSPENMVTSIFSCPVRKTKDRGCEKFNLDISHLCHFPRRYCV